MEAGREGRLREARLCLGGGLCDEGMFLAGGSAGSRASFDSFEKGCDLLETFLLWMAQSQLAHGAGIDRGTTGGLFMH